MNKVFKDGTVYFKYIFRHSRLKTMYISSSAFLLRMLPEDVLQLSQGENQEREKLGIQEMRPNRKAKGKAEMMGRKLCSRP